MAYTIRMEMSTMCNILLSSRISDLLDHAQSGIPGLVECTWSRILGLVDVMLDHTQSRIPGSGGMCSIWNSGLRSAGLCSVDKACVWHNVNGAKLACADLSCSLNKTEIEKLSASTRSAV